VKCWMDGRERQQTRHVCFPRYPPYSPDCYPYVYPAFGFHVAISYPTNPEVLEGSDLSWAPVPDWSSSIFPTPRPTRVHRRRASGSLTRRAGDTSTPPAGQLYYRVWSDIILSRFYVTTSQSYFIHTLI